MAYSLLRPILDIEGRYSIPSSTKAVPSVSSGCGSRTIQRCAGCSLWSPVVRDIGKLCLQRMIPWSESGEMTISRLQWEAFQEAQDEFMADLPWFEWDGPNPHYLGIWLGHPDGLRHNAATAESRLRSDSADGIAGAEVRRVRAACRMEFSVSPMRSKSRASDRCVLAMLLRIKWSIR